MRDLLLRLIGWPATILHGDPSVFERWQWLARHLERGPRFTFDAGCGTGAYTMYAAKVGNTAIGLTIDADSKHRAASRAAALGIQNVNFVQGDLRELDRNDLFSEGQFDQIICFEVIEHIMNDSKLVTDLSRLLKPGGRLLLTTPNIHYKPLYGDRLSAWEAGGHVRWGYTIEELRALFRENDIELVTEDYVSGFLSQKLQNLMRILARRNGVLGWLLTFPLRTFLVLDPIVTRRLRYPSQSVCVIGVKSRAA